MHKFFTFLTLILLSVSVKAQNSTEVQPFGKIDTADLRLTTCSFENGANAEVLFDKADVNIDAYGIITFIRHKRIKIFNDNGKDAANIRIEYIDNITDIEAQTINLNGKTIVFTPVDSKLIYKEKTDKYQKSLVFTFPDVKAGSVIEFQYKWKISDWFFPHWFFQSDIPTRYSELQTTLTEDLSTQITYKINQPFCKDTDIIIGSKDHPRGRIHIRALSNVHSFKDEPYMTPVSDNMQRAVFKSTRASWNRVCLNLTDDEDFGKQILFKLSGEKALIAKFDSIKNKQAKIDTIFNIVKNRMAWNNENRWYTIDGTQKAWNKKTGNSTEINLILCRLLTSAGIIAYPLVVSTDDNGSIDPNFPSILQFNKTVVCAQLDTSRIYIMDASNKHNMYNQLPYELLSSYGLLIYPKFDLFHNLSFINSDTLATKVIYITADIKPGGKMSGTAQIACESYNRVTSLKLYKDLGEKKYIDYLADDNNDLKISSLKMENMDNDTLPLIETANFDLNLSASDENYIYFSPNIFTSFGTNPFLGETRYSNIDFSYRNNYIISGNYAIPAGYKVDILPKNTIMTSPDKSISFKRIAGLQDNTIQVHYVITRKRTLYPKKEYPMLHEFYKKMYELLNEQIVLKKYN
jgi:hypothetical protein